LRRRDFITAIGAAAAWPLAVRARPATTVIGFLSGAPSADAFAPYVAAFRAGLAETGHVEGSSLIIEFRWADGQYAGLPALPTLADEVIE
jgi:putative tryptophan/tyrosine transport system substrate-binding protein